MLRGNEPPDRKEIGERWVKWFLQDPDKEMLWGGLNLDKMMMPHLEVFKTWTKSVFIALVWSFFTALGSG